MVHLQARRKEQEGTRLAGRAVPRLLFFLATGTRLLYKRGLYKVPYDTIFFFYI